MSRGVALRGELKGENPEGGGKPSLNRAPLPDGRAAARPSVAQCRPETGGATHGQGEARLVPRGGPNPPVLQYQGMSWGEGGKDVAPLKQPGGWLRSSHPLKSA